MPYCTQCGQEAAATDVYCAHCGAEQSSSARQKESYVPPAAPADPLSGMSARTAAILCYIPTIGWIPAVIVLASRKFRQDHIVRFHAFQGLYLFAAWLVVTWVIRPLSMAMSSHLLRADQILETILILTSIFMMVKASHNEPYVLPIVGELAQRSSLEH